MSAAISNGRGRLRCKQCRNDAVARRRKKVKRLLVEYKGGKCERCSYDRCVEALDFHHRDPNEKDFSISKDGHTLALEKLKQEVDKCDLVCANCHREIHAGYV
jgi:hypothetical protein